MNRSISVCEQPWAFACDGWQVVILILMIVVVVVVVAAAAAVVVVVAGRGLILILMIHSNITGTTNSAIS